MLFTSEATLKQLFVEGLQRLTGLFPDDPASMIVALANAACTGEVSRRFPDRVLREAFARCAVDMCRREACEPGDAKIVGELVQSGRSHFRKMSVRRAGKFLKVFNPVRGLRPKRWAALPADSIFQPFDESFNFLQPRVARGCFWEGQIDGFPFAAFYNKFPFAPWHFLLFPEIHRKHPQILTEGIHHRVFGLPGTAGIGELVAGYNSAGAFASVGHLHFQMCLGRESFAVTDPCWTVNGGRRPYPACCTRFTSPVSSWQWIRSLHDRDVAYNLLYTSEGMYGFARRKQGHYRHSRQMPNFAFSEMSGRIVFTQFGAFERAGARAIRDEFRRLTLDR